MVATTVTTRAIKGSALTHNEMDTNWNNLNNVGMFVGTIFAWPIPTLPDSTCLECNGQSVTVAGYPDLFSRIGYTFGGSGANFNVPDFRGYFLRGWDHGAGNDPDAASRTDRGDGTTGDNIGTKQEDEFEEHSHLTSKDTGNFSSVGGGGPVAFGDPLTWTNSTTETGGNETRPKNINVMWVIKAKLS